MGEPYDEITYVLLTEQDRHEWRIFRFKTDDPVATAKIAEWDMLGESYDHVTSLMAVSLELSGERFLRWWIETGDGTVLEAHEELVAWTRRHKRHRIRSGQLASESERVTA